MISWSNRGQGSCPNCATVYFNRSKPVECSNCGYHLGGSAAAKMPKLSCPVAVHIHGGLYSLRTNTRDDRCFVYKECDNWICLHSKCKDIRAMYVSSNRTDEFSCQHLKHVAESVEASGIFPLTEDKISSYPCDSATKEMLKNVVVPAGHEAVYKVSDRTFVVYCQPSATNTLGFCHVKAEDGKNGKYHKCCCKGFLAKGKQEKSRAICDHLHVLFCCTELHNTVYSSTTVLSTSAASPSSESTSSLSEDPQHAVSTSPAAPFSSESISSLSEDPQQPVSRASTLQLYANEKLPYRYSTQFLNLVSRKDAATHLSCSGQGWPSIFEVADTSCRLCGNPLGQSKVHSGSRGGSVLYSNFNPFKKVVVRVKECSSSLWLFNVSDKILISFDILLEWRELFRRGCPVLNFIEAKTDLLVMKLNKDQCPTMEKVRYYNELLYNGFWCFEMMTERNLSEAVCGICGVIGEVYLGDGNEKNCCSNSKIVYPSDGVPLKEMMGLEDFLQKLKLHLMEKVIYTKANNDLIINSEELPPVIAPVLRGSVVYNSENDKKSVFLKNSVASGDPAILHKEIKEKNLNMARIQDCAVDELKELCSRCNIPVSGKSKVKLCTDLQALYSSMLVGLCPCHGFTKVPGHTGGFYHLVCRHGYTVASKFLTLTESVRDAADLYMSLKYPPIVFICDSPCGMVRHLECRVPHLCEALWGENSGCFEKPEYAKKPAEEVDCPFIVPAEYRSSYFPEVSDDLGEMEHPVSRCSQRFILGDRFHNSTKPHKSPLCLFHNIDLCKQSTTIKTSYQDSENFRKNMKRLRSSTLQGFGLHFCFNFLMDYYQNEAIVMQQECRLSKQLKEGQQLVRDNYHRFTVVNSVPS